MNRSILIIIPLSTILSMCTTKNTNKPIAKVDGITISLRDVDKLIQQELYADLYHIYFLRNTALTEIIKDKLIEFEANKNSLERDEFIKEYIGIHFDTTEFYKLSEQDFFKNGIPSVTTGRLEYIKRDSPMGQKYILEEYKEILISNLVDSLKQIYKVESYLTQPISPIKNLGNIYAHYVGDLNSPVTIFILSDFDCIICKEYHKMYEDLFKKYSNKVKFGYVNFASTPSIKTIAVECAAKQGYFKEMYNTFFELNGNVDSIKIFEIAKEIGIELIEFKRDLESNINYDKINSNYSYLLEEGFFTTPTIIVNSKIVNNPLSPIELDSIVNHELNKF